MSDQKLNKDEIQGSIKKWDEIQARKKIPIPQKANQAQKHFNPYTSTTVQDKFRKEIVDSKIAQLKQKGNEKVLNEITQRAEKLESISSSRDPNYLHLDKIFSKKIQGLSIGDASKLEFLNTWQLTYDRRGLIGRQTVDNYENNILTIKKFSNVAEFWNTWNFIKAPSKMELTCNFHCFVHGIKPTWEDPANETGGKWTLIFQNSPKLLDETWLRLVLAVVGGTLKPHEKICGLVFSRRQKGDRISIWIRDMPHSEIKDLASDMIIITKLLDCGSPYVLEYQRHKESVKTGTSFRSSASENKKNSVLSQDNVEENARARLKSSETTNNKTVFPYNMIPSPWISKEERKHIISSSKSIEEKVKTPRIISNEDSLIQTLVSKTIHPIDQISTTSLPSTSKPLSNLKSSLQSLPDISSMSNNHISTKASASKISFIISQPSERRHSDRPNMTAIRRHSDQKLEKSGPLDNSLSRNTIQKSVSTKSLLTVSDVSKVGDTVKVMHKANSSHSVNYVQLPKKRKSNTLSYSRSLSVLNDNVGKRLSQSHTSSSLAKISPNHVSPIKLNPIIENKIQNHEKSEDTPITQDSSNSSLEEAFIIKFPATIHQQSIYNIMSPPLDQPKQTYVNRLNFITHCYTTTIPHEFYAIHETIVHAAVQKVRSEIALLRTTFFRNDKILDADVEGILDNRNYKYKGSNSINNGSTFELDKEEESSKYFQSHSIDFEQKLYSVIYDHISTELSNSKSYENPFKVFLFTPKTSQENQIIIVIALSTLIADEFSCTFISHEIQNIITKIIDELKGPDYLKNLFHLKSLLSYEGCDKNYDYIDFAFNVHQRISKRPALVNQAISILKDQLVENVVLNDDEEKSKIRERIQILNPIIDSWKYQMKKLEQELRVKEKEFERATEQRKILDLQEYSENQGDVISYTDSLTGQMVYINSKAKAALIESVLESNSDDESVYSLLKRHDVSISAISKLTDDQLKITNFIRLSPETFDFLIMTSKDRTKLKALVEFVRLKLKEAFEEQVKVKSALERKIQKLSREIITIKESATQAESLFEENESEKIILESKLKFEIQKLKLPFASITKNSASNQSITSLERSVLDLSIQGDIPDKIDSDIPSFPKNNMKLNSLPEPRPLGSNVKISKFVEYGYSPIKIEESLFKRIDTISGSWDRIFQSPLDLPIEKISTRGRAMQFTCLTAFAILLKHWIGKDKFIIGHSFSIRQHSHYIASESGQIEKQKISTSPYIGPLTSLIPVKIDVSDAQLSFAGLYSKLSKQLTSLINNLIFCPKDSFSRGLQGIVSIPVLRNYVNSGMQLYQETELERVMKSISVSQLLNTNESSESISDNHSNNELLEFPIQMEYFQNISWEDIYKQGIKISNNNTGSFQQNWAIDTSEPFELKLIIIEHGDKIEAGFRYRKDLIDELTITKWSDRMANILYEIEDSGTNYTVSKLIGRFYGSILSLPK